MANFTAENVPFGRYFNETLYLVSAYGNHNNAYTVRNTNKIRDWNRSKRLKKEAQKTCRKAYNKFTYDIIHSDPGSERNKGLGALIKSKRCDITVAPLKDQGFLHSDPKAKANILNKQFISVFSVDDGFLPS